jgi:hypothetical protein
MVQSLYVLQRYGPHSGCSSHYWDYPYLLYLQTGTNRSRPVGCTLLAPSLSASQSVSISESYQSLYISSTYRSGFITTHVITMFRAGTREENHSPYRHSPVLPESSHFRGIDKIKERKRTLKYPRNRYREHIARNTSRCKDCNGYIAIGVVLVRDFSGSACAIEVRVNVLSYRYCHPLPDPPSTSFQRASPFP